MTLLEPPAAGPGPLLNTIRNASGKLDVGIIGFAGDYKNPILKPGASDVVRERGTTTLSGKPFPDPSNQCWPAPPPYTFAVRGGVQILQQRDTVTLIFFGDQLVRQVRLNDSHPKAVAPSWRGDSVGRYEGDTLVVDTIGFKVGRFSMVDLYGTPHSEQLRVIEHYRLIDGEAAKAAQEKHVSTYFDAAADTSSVAYEAMSPFGRGPLDPDTMKKGLQVEITVEDPQIFTTPWSGLVTYRPITGEWPEVICAESMYRYHDQKDAEVPRADRPDF